jgi:hypothetical protein
MIQLFAIQPYTSLVFFGGELDIAGGGILIDSLNGSKREPYQLKLIIKPTLKEFDLFKNQLNIGVRFKNILKDGTVNFDIAFYKDRQSQINRANGYIEILFRSMCGLLDLKEPKLIPSFSVISSTPQNFLNSISSNYIFKYIGQSSNNVNIITGNLGNLQLINTLADTLGNVTWREGNIENNLPVIQFGQFENLAKVATARSYYIDDPNSFDFRILNAPKQNLNGNVVTHLKVISSLSTGNGADENSSIFLDGSIQIDPAYPLVDLGERTAQGKIIYRIFNTQAFAQIGVIQLDETTINIASNMIDSQTGQQLQDLQQGKQSIYNQAVGQLKKQGFGFSYSIQFQAKKMLLPCDKVLINFESSLEINGKNKDILTIKNYELIVDKMEYKSNDLANL